MLGTFKLHDAKRPLFIVCMVSIPQKHAFNVAMEWMQFVHTTPMHDDVKYSWLICRFKVMLFGFFFFFCLF